MRFRQTNDGKRNWHDWRETHRDTLVRSGVPDFIYGDEMRWFGFLEHDGFDHESKWSVELLSAHEAGVLSEFLVSEYGREKYRFLINSLDQLRLKSTPD